MEVRAELERSASQLEQRYSLREAARILEVPEARLRAMARAGFLAPQRGPIGPLSFGFQDLLLLRTTKELLESGVPMRRIRRTWASLRAQLAEGAALTSIMIDADGEEIVATDGTNRWRPDSGQIVLDFSAGAIAERAADAAVFPRPRRIEDPGTPRAAGPHETQASRSIPALIDGPAFQGDVTAEDWYESGCELEAESPAQAREAYERALELDPDLAEAHVNLGRLLHLAGERGRAEPHYREAVRLDPVDPTPHFNLGVMLDELGRKDEAVHAYRQAILRDPEFADAHCNLGLLLESLARRSEAMRHLMAARRLMEASE